VFLIGGYFADLMSSIPRTPRRPSSHTLGDVGRTYVKLLLERWGWTADIVQSDYGEDLDCTIFAEGHRTALQFRCQIKSMARPRRSRSGDFLVRVSARTCTAWLQSYQPVLLTIYDNNTDVAYVVNATGVLRHQPAALTRRMVLFRIPSTRPLSESRDAVVSEVQDHYAGFLRVSDSTLHCIAFPVLMPEYRTVPPTVRFDCGDWDWSQRHQDHLPAWTTVLESFGSEYLVGLERDFARSTVEDVHKSLAAAVTSSEGLGLRTDQWVAFSCSPIRFSAERAEGPSVWTGELTDWWSVAQIHGKLIDDRRYAFEPPPGFVPEIARHARSWDDYYHVDLARDLAIQLYAATPLTPAFRNRSKALRQHAVGQLLPWSCPLRMVSQLDSQLNSAGMVFTPIADLCTNEIAVGIIHDPMFTSESGFMAIPLALDWSTFDKGAVRKALETVPAAQLPGSEASAKIIDHVLRRLASPAFNPSEVFMGVERDTPVGLPVNIGKRRILVERFHELLEPLNEKPMAALATKGRKTLRDAHPTLQNLDVAFEVHDTGTCNMARLAVSWAPSIEESSFGAFLTIELVLLDVFDSLLSRRTGGGNRPMGTFDVLRLEGSLYFDAFLPRDGSHRR
jgi:hypothetical protein